jgi:hypothetical protein
MTVEQAAAKVWASASPITPAARVVTGGSPRAAAGGSPRAAAGDDSSNTRSAGNVDGAGRAAISDCGQLRPRTPELTLRLHAGPVCTPRRYAHRAARAEGA